SPLFASGAHVRVCGSAGGCCCGARIGPRFESRATFQPRRSSVPRAPVVGFSVPSGLRTDPPELVWNAAAGATLLKVRSASSVTTAKMTKEVYCVFNGGYSFRDEIFNLRRHTRLSITMF